MALFAIQHFLQFLSGFGSKLEHRESALLASLSVLVAAHAIPF